MYAPFGAVLHSDRHRIAHFAESSAIATSFTVKFQFNRTPSQAAGSKGLLALENVERSGAIAPKAAEERSEK